MKKGKLFEVTALLTILLFSTATKLPITNFSQMGIIRHDTNINKYIELGNKPEFNCVGRYSESVDGKDFAGGVLITPKWVLTASHFVQDTSFWKFGDKIYQTKRIIPHPKLIPGSEERQWDGWDMVLIELNEPVLDITPAKRYYGDKELGKTITKIGYGFIGNGKTGMDNPRKQEKLGGQNVVDAIGGIFENRKFSINVMVCDFDSPETSEFNKFGSDMPVELEIGGSKGDSGGGIFMEDNGEIVFIGIVSGALNREIKYGSVLALARVSTANEWIDSLVSE